MGFYDDRIVPRAIDLLLGGAAFGDLRRRALQHTEGTVVELGFGSGTNLPYYPSSVHRVLAVEPSDHARHLARKRLAASGIEVEFVGLDGQALPLEDESVDHVVSTWTLCSIDDLDAALGEVRRVLRPGGRLHFLEHGISDDPRVARRQRRWNGLQQRCAGGCRLDRDHGAAVTAAGLVLDDLANFSPAGPRHLGYMYAGTARRA